VTERYRRLHNEQIYDLCSMCAIKSARIELMRHVVRMGTGRENAGL
jgi:hypothetical protein